VTAYPNVVSGAYLINYVARDQYVENLSEKDFSNCKVIMNGYLTNEEGEAALSQTRPLREKNVKCDERKLKPVIEVIDQSVQAMETALSTDMLYNYLFQIDTITVSDAWSVDN